MTQIEFILPLLLFATAVIYLGWKFNRPLTAPPPAPKSWSAMRNTASYLAIVLALTALVALVAFEFGPAVKEPKPALLLIVIYAAPAFSLVYFCSVILYVLFLTIGRNTFDADAIRLARDTAISILFSICAAALLYKHLGIVATFTTEKIHALDHLYFSAVTFSTLGYGDFRPSPDARWVAGLHAIIGNIHLGIVVGTVMVALKGRPD